MAENIVSALVLQQKALVMEEQLGQRPVAQEAAQVSNLKLLKAF